VTGDPAELLHENVSGLLDGFDCEIKHNSILAQILPAKYAKGTRKQELYFRVFFVWLVCFVVAS
jgi:hypothetical protein